MVTKNFLSAPVRLPGAQYGAPIQSPCTKLGNLATLNIWFLNVSHTLDKGWLVVDLPL
jgi:hypothetical protein